ncbi:hypothetical protein ILYODFUR_031631 [Ilyodon furcidens]|uniref:Uncharacterized protein n=1 Tax=Ilyodon furcidens TaxID=33524 RepID=A0ABV0TFK7_9TELE
MPDYFAHMSGNQFSRSHHVLGFQRFASSLSEFSGEVTAHLAAPQVHAVRRPQQPSGITHLPVHPQALHSLSCVLLEERIGKSLPTSTTHHHLPTSASVGILTFPP